MKKILIIIILLAFLQGPTFADSRNYSELSGILKKTIKAHSPYQLVLDGDLNTFYLRGELLETVKEGERIWVKGKIESDLYLTSQDSPSPNGWHIYMSVKTFKVITKPFNGARK